MVARRPRGRKSRAAWPSGFLVLLMGCGNCSTKQPNVPADQGFWKAIDNTGSPSAGLGQAAVTVGSQVFVWGGSGPCGAAAACGDGAIYDPASDRWRRVTDEGAPQARYHHTAVFTGSRVLVWGGVGCGGINVPCGDGGAYDPAAGQWMLLEQNGAPAPRGLHSAVWTGSQMIVWGGEDFTTHALLSDGARFEPDRGEWRAMSTNGAPSARRFHSAVWDGAQMIVWGGDSSATQDEGLGDGRLYDPEKDSWTTVISTGAPAPRYAHTAVWTGKEMVIWGGLERGSSGEIVPRGDGARYDPARDAWTPLSVAGAPSARAGHSAVWTGRHMIVWGGSAPRCADGSSGACADGGVYDPAMDRWMPLQGPPAARRANHVAVRTDGSMFLWGGIGGPPAESAILEGMLYSPSR